MGPKSINSKRGVSLPPKSKTSPHGREDSSLHGKEDLPICREFFQASQPLSAPCPPSSSPDDRPRSFRKLAFDNCAPVDSLKDPRKRAREASVCVRQDKEIPLSSPPEVKKVKFQPEALELDSNSNKLSSASHSLPASKNTTPEKNVLGEGCFSRVYRERNLSGMVVKASKPIMTKEMFLRLGGFYKLAQLADIPVAESSFEYSNSENIIYIEQTEISEDIKSLYAGQREQVFEFFCSFVDKLSSLWALGIFVLFDPNRDNFRVQNKIDSYEFFMTDFGHEVDMDYDTGYEFMMFFLSVLKSWEFTEKENNKLFSLIAQNLNEKKKHFSNEEKLKKLFQDEIKPYFSDLALIRINRKEEYLSDMCKKLLEVFS